MARETIAVQSGVYADGGDKVDSAFFGGNFLFDRDKIGDEGTYDEKAEALNLGMLRYPGGTITEKLFDIRNPDEAIKPGAHGDDVMPLSEFIAHLNDVGTTASLVLPSIRYMDALRDGEMSRGEVRAEFRTFLTDLRDGVYGDASRFEVLEIGNEFYDPKVNPDGDAADYGAFARLVAQEIRAVFGDDIDIGVQGGRNWANNTDILNAFEGRDELVDQVIYHEYSFHAGEVGQRVGWKEAQFSRWTDSGLAEDVFLSEWGISNKRFWPDGTEIREGRIDDGLARGIAMVDLASRLIESGVDMAAVWPVQQNTRGDLAGDEGETAATHGFKLSENNLTVAGEAFRLMAEAAPGKQMLDLDPWIDLDGAQEGQRFPHEALVRGFEDDDSIVLFVAAWDIGPELGGATLDFEFGGQFDSYDVTTLTVNGADYRSPNADPVLIEETGLQYDGDLSITFLRDYELKRVTLWKAEGGFEPAQRLKAVRGSQEDDVLMGGVEGEHLKARAGDDFVSANAGDDRVSGGGGQDRLRGDGGDDTLLGGAGADSIAGGAANDDLMGGGAADVLRGQRGADDILGGGGADTLLGGAGADRLEGGGGDDLLKGQGGADDLDGAAGDDRLFGGGGDDSLSGGDGADVLNAGPGDDLAAGGAGADTFILNRGDGALTLSDFESGVDVIRFGPAQRFGDLRIEDGVDGAEVSAGGVDLRLLGVEAASLSASDFIF